MKLISLKCPDCGAHLEIEDNRTEFFCTYCGAHVMLNNENEYIYRHVDEAKIKETEAEYAYRLKQLELEEKREEQAKKLLIFKIGLSILLGLLAIISFSTDLINTAVGPISLLALMFIWNVPRE